MSAWLLVKGQHLLDRPGGVRRRGWEGRWGWWLMYNAWLQEEGVRQRASWGPSRRDRLTQPDSSLGGFLCITSPGSTGPVCAAPWPWARLWHGRLIYVRVTGLCCNIDSNSWRTTWRSGRNKRRMMNRPWWRSHLGWILWLFVYLFVFEIS